MRCCLQPRKTSKRFATRAVFLKNCCCYRPCHARIISLIWSPIRTASSTKWRLFRKLSAGCRKKRRMCLINAAAKRVFDENKQYSKTNNVYVWLIAARDAFAQDRQRGRTRGPKPAALPAELKVGKANDSERRIFFTSGPPVLSSKTRTSIYEKLF